jgi:hypothetical protein
MGNSACCSSKDFEFTSSSNDWTKSIERSDLKSLTYLINHLQKQDQKLDDPLIIIKTICISPLSYSVLSGNRLIFKFLYEKGASLSEMDKNLQAYNLTAIDIICERNYLSLLEFYLPLYLKSYQDSSNDSVSIDPTLNFGPSADFGSVSYSTPVQKACEKGFIAIIVFFNKFFKDKKLPRPFDVNYPNDKTGETCALIACRKGNFAMVKTLNEVCGADFNVKNRFEENAIVVSACAYKLDKKGDYLGIIRYLVDKVGLDITFMYEELLMLSNCEELTYYIEQQLQMRNIFVTKDDVELKYGVKKYKVMDSFESNSGFDFFSSSIRRYLDDCEERSRISTVTYVDSKTDIIYASIFSHAS